MPPTEANADANVGAVQATTEAAPSPAPKRFVRNQVRGDTTAGAFSIFYFRDGKLLGADSVNSPADHMACRRLLSGGKELDPRSAADTTINLMQLAKG